MSSSSDEFRVAFVGAGQINFGSPEGPWNHSIRLEKRLGQRLRVVALIDPFESAAQGVLDMKRASDAQHAYKDTEIFASLEEYLAQVTPEKRPHAFWVGSPPSTRGSLQPGRNTEAMIANALPGVAMFVEKPITTSSVEEVMATSSYISDKVSPVAVGYMFRYLKPVQMMKQIIAENNLEVMAVNCRYIIAYEKLVKQWWWNKDVSLGPVIEQATHFCDLARYFGGEVELDSVIAHTLEYFEKPGKLSKIGFDEDVDIPAEKRVPRVTSATWKFESGAVGSLMHVIAMHGRDFFTELHVLADGYSMRLCDAYNAPALYVRRPGSDKEEEYKFTDDDPFYAEVACAADAMEDVSKSDAIQSTFGDAARTYAFTWAIRQASEQMVTKRAVAKHL